MAWVGKDSAKDSSKDSPDSSFVLPEEIKQQELVDFVF